MKAEDLFVQSPVGIGVYNGPTHTIELVNDLMLEYWGRTREQVLHKPLFDALPEARGQGFEEIIAKVYHTGDPYVSTEIPVNLHRKGTLETIFTRLIFTPLKDPDGAISGVMGLAHDITELVLARKGIERNGRKFQQLVEDVPVGITIFRGPEFIVETANEAYMQIIDRPKASFMGKPLFDVLPEVRPAVEPLLNDVYWKGIPYYGTEFEVTLNRHGKKELAYFNFVYHPLREENVVMGVVVVAIDVTTSVKRKMSIEESEKRFRSFVDDSPIAMAVFRGEDSIIELANKTLLERIWRRDAGEVIGKRLLNVFPELADQPFPALIRQVMDSGIAHREKEALAYVDGSGGLRAFYLDFEYSPLYNNEGVVDGIMVTVNDVTERVNARKLLEEAEEWTRLAMEASLAGAFDVDLLSDHMKCSQRFAGIFGLPPAAITPSELIRRIHPDDIVTRDQAHVVANETGILQYEIRFMTQNQGYRWIRMQGKFIRNDKNQWARLLGTIVDITDQVNFTGELEKKVKERTLELQAANNELALRNQELISFNYISSHDLQEPLRKIQTFASRIQSTEAKLDPENMVYFKKIQQSANQMQMLIRDLLEYSRAGEGEKQLKKIDLNEILQHLRVQILDEHAAATPQTATPQIIIGDLPTINAIPFQINQLFSNLLSNAVKFTRKKKDPTIRVEASTTQEDHVIRVTDNGIGFSPEYKEHIFEVFRRLHNRSEYEGTGIGLAICKKIVENHHGRISAQGKPGEGATFTVFLPK